MKSAELQEPGCLSVLAPWTPVPPSPNTVLYQLDQSFVVSQST